MVLRIEPVQSRLYIFNFAPALVVLAFTQSCAPKIEAQHRKPEGVQGLHRVVHNLVVHRATVERMRMTDQGGVRCIRLPFVQQRFQPAGRTIYEK